MSSRTDSLVPEAFIDPITQDIFTDPVVTSDGHTYSRSAIERWLASHNTSPASGAVLPNLPGTRNPDKRLVPNIAVRKAIEEWRARRPMAIDPSLLTLTSELLGEGSFGVVIAGTLATGSGRPPLAVAVKMMPALSRDDERTAFDRELRAHMLAAQNCDGICVLHGTCEKPQNEVPRMAIVMKRYDRSLAAQIERAGDGLDPPLAAARAAAARAAVVREGAAMAVEATEEGARAAAVREAAGEGGGGEGGGGEGGGGEGGGGDGGGGGGGDGEPDGGGAGRAEGGGGVGGEAGGSAEGGATGATPVSVHSQIASLDSNRVVHSIE